MLCQRDLEAAELAAGLVNALTGVAASGRPFLAPGGADRARSATDAIRAADPDCELLSESEADRLTDFARCLRIVFAMFGEAPPVAAEEVNRLLRRTAVAPELTGTEGAWKVNHRGAPGSPAVEWAGSAAWGLASALSTGTKLGVCAAPRCDRVFIDRSRTATRRFCGDTCHNRVKVAKYRLRIQTKSAQA